jgi:hypothetical protein
MMKRFTISALTALLLACFVGASFAWELELKGENIARYRYVTRTGNMDIFGPVNGWPDLGINNLDTYPSPNTNNAYSGTYGVIAGEPGFGSDKDLYDLMVNLHPKIKVNPAVELSGMVNLTSMGIHSSGGPYDTEGTNGMENELWVPIGNRPASVNVPNTFITLARWQAKVTTPMATFAYGFRGSLRGMGLTYNPLDRPSTSFTITTQYGPLVFSYAPYFARFGSVWGRGGAFGDRDAGGNTNPWRKDAHRNYLDGFAGAMSYTEGPFQFIVNTNWYSIPAYQQSAGSYVPRVALATGSNTANRYAAAASIPAGDMRHFAIHLTAKYFNGRFFFNAEAARFMTNRSGRGVATAVAGNFIRTIDTDNLAWAYGVETGAVTGPLKTTLTYFRATGDDPNTRTTNEEMGAASQGISSTYVKNWAYLMYYYYGAGNYWDGSGKGTPSNLHHVGIRMDYAAASNLNLFAVWSHAWRDQPNAFQLAGNWLAGALRFSNDTILTIQGAGGAQTAAAHQAVPDHARNIGWEIDAGWDWKILENLTWNLTAAYWKPGNWWAFAYPNTAMLYRTQPRDGTPLLAGTITQATADLGRDIDPLVSLEMSLRIDF